MRQKKPLRASTPLRRRRALRSVGLKPARRPSAKKLEGLVPGDWLRQVIEETAHTERVRGHRRYVCPICEQPPEAGRRLEGHHVVSKQRLKQYVRSLGLDPADARVRLQELLWDVRNGLAACGSCHSRHTQAAERIPRSALLPRHFEFAAELGLTYFLERYYPA